MGLLSWIIIGLAVGFICRRFFPGRPGGLIATLVLAVVGALVGGYIGAFFNYGTLGEMEPRALLIALAGALLMVLVARKLRL
ncbi:GlsB/YeaQ/YmgE family stress response membrane protein [Erwinia sp. CGal63]|uniref:GlsB/YeaQ/YmgE family stress response membrane protein n=1 Tax=Erwinia sp. CGal63 TaxID=2919889 RepID=UPI00300B8580